MALKASEISELLKQRIKNFESAAEARDVGTVIAVTDGICRIHGLAGAKYGEMLEFPATAEGVPTLPRACGAQCRFVAADTPVDGRASAPR